MSAGRHGRRVASRHVDPRFDLVLPNAKALTWNQMGNGNWATASTYATTILTRYDEAGTFSGVR